MTAIQYALYRYAAGLMTVAELRRAEELAKQADAGDRLAALSYQDLVHSVLRRRWNAKDEQSANNKL
jgi:hypothetical protein